MSVINPLTNKAIKFHGKTHLILIKQGILPNERYVVPKPNLKTVGKSYHFSNIKDLSKAIKISPWTLIDHLSKDFTFKIIVDNESLLLIFPQYEPFLENAIMVFIDTRKCPKCSLLEVREEIFNTCEACGFAL